MKKFLLKISIFMIIFLIFFSFISSIFVRKGNGYGTDVLSFYNEEKNSIDLIFFGSSHSYSTFSPNILEEEIGIKAYNFSTQQQPLWITYHYMKETLKTQKPKYFVLEILMTSVNNEYMEEGVNRDAIDKMKFSINKIQTINASVEKHSDRISYYINFIKYHSRWNDLMKMDITSLLKSNISKTKGFTYLEGNNGTASKNDITNIKEVKKISKKNTIYLNKIIELANQNNIELILVKSPCTITEESQKYYNYIEQIAKENNIYYLNYNLIYDEIKIDFDNDFYDSGHLNGTAAEKVTKHFANYLNNKFNIKGEKKTND